MDNVNKTLYIPLYGKAYVSRRELKKVKEKSIFTIIYLTFMSINFADYLNINRLKKKPRTKRIRLTKNPNLKIQRDDS